MSLFLGPADTKDVIQHLNQAIDICIEIDSAVPWKSIFEKRQEITNHHPVRTDANLVANIVTSIMNIEDAQFSFSQNTYEWCSISKDLLSTYTGKFNDLNKSDRGRTALKAMVLRSIESAVKNLNSSQKKLDDIRAQLTATTSDLATVNNHLAGSNRPEADKAFYLALQNDINEANRIINGKENKLADKATVIGRLQVQISERSYDEIDDNLRDEILESTNTFIGKCNEYIEKHKP